MRKIIFWCALTTVLALSLMPGPMVPTGMGFWDWDKAQHFLGFFGLTGLGLLAYPKKLLLHMGGYFVLLGGFIEVAQWATGWRQGDWLDLLADVIGVGAALVLWQVWRVFRSRFSPAQP
jgi:VanZ family protein